MNLEDTRSIILSYADRDALLNLCFTDKISRKICSDKNFQQNWFKYNHLINYETDNFEDFIFTLKTLKRVDEEFNNINNGYPFTTNYTSGKNNIINVEIKKKDNYWQVKYYGTRMKTNVSLYRDINNVKDLLYDLI